jgi:hypothetical protein
MTTILTGIVSARTVCTRKHPMTGVMKETGMQTIRGRTGWRAAIGAATIVIVSGAGQAAFAAEPAPATPASQATIIVDDAPPGGRLPSDFVGLSYEERELGVGSFDAGKGNLVNLFRTLGRSNVRISGNTLDRDTLWVPKGQQPPSPLPDWVQDVVTPTDIKRLDGFLRATGWKAEVGINVGRWDAALGADQAKSMFSILGPRLAAAECGNEPNSWVGKGFRPSGYGYPQYKPDWEACAAAVGNNRIAGPDTSSPTSTAAWVDSFAKDERNRINMIMIHNYSVSATATVTDLLSPATNTKQMNAVAPELASAKAVNVPIRLDETNSAAGGGGAGMSDTYASALWAMDYSLQMVQAGFAGVNLHGGLGVCGAPLYNGKFQLYTPICAANDADEKAKIYKAMPEYYGLWMASQVGPGRFLPVNLSTDRNVRAYAVRGDDGRIRIAVIQKDDTTTAPVHLDIKVGGRSRGAEVLRLTGATLAGQDTAVQGRTVDRRGNLNVRPGRARVSGGSVGIDLAGGSAVLITLDRDCGGRHFD